MHSKKYQDGITLNLNNCPFCNEQVGIPFDGFSENTKKIKSRIVKFNNFIIIPDLSPIKFGHTLFCSKEHISNFSLNKIGFYEEIEVFIKKFYSNILENIFFFEHGTSSCISPNGCVEHAHIHIVPINSSISKKIIINIEKIEGISICLKKSIAEEYSWLKENSDSKHYILIGKYNDKEGMLVSSWVSEFIPSQFIRHIIASELNIPPHLKDKSEREIAFIQTLDYLKNLTVLE